MSQRPIKTDIFTQQDGFALQGTRCQQCGAVRFASYDFCPQCLSREGEVIPLNGEGVLHTYTVTRVPVGPFALPHAIGMIDLTEGVRIVAPLGGTEPFQIGGKMQVKGEVLFQEESGDEVFGYRFYPVEEEA